MAITVVIHISNEEPIIGELDDLPSVVDTLVAVHNPRRRDGKDISYLSSDAITVIWPVSQITFIEVMPSESAEKLIGFVKE
jgi:hypothetical protein